MADEGDRVIDASDDELIPPEYRDMRFWKRGFDTAKTWYHEEWDGGYIQLDLARDIANAIAIEVARVSEDYL